MVTLKPASEGERESRGGDGGGGDGGGGVKRERYGKHAVPMVTHERDPERGR